MESRRERSWWKERREKIGNMKYDYDEIEDDDDFITG